MRIYIAGPYTAAPGGTPEQRQEQVKKNIARADELGRQLVALGHTPLVPHTMMRDWEESGVRRADVERVCLEWVAECDGLLYLGPSPGADLERAAAIALKLPIYSPEQLPGAESASPVLQQRVFEGYMAEYTECAESYRHTYATIWQAGSVFAAISAGVLAVWGQRPDPLSSAVVMLALLPVVYWYQGIFRPMNRYGEGRRSRLKLLERELARLVPGLHMSHFSSDSSSDAKPNLRNLLWMPRVVWYATGLGMTLSVAELLYWGYRLFGWLTGG